MNSQARDCSKFHVKYVMECRRACEAAPTVRWKVLVPRDSMVLMVYFGPIELIIPSVTKFSER